MSNVYTAIILSMLLMPGIAFSAANAIWKGEAELGLLITKGNTETDNINARATVTNDREKWRHTGHIAVLKSTDNDMTTAEKYLVSGKSDYKISDVSYIFGILAYEVEKFSGFDNRSSENIGYGRSVLKNDRLSLELELGVGARQSKLESNGETLDEILVRAAAIFSWKLGDNATFSEDLTIEAGDDSTITKSVTALKSQVAGNLSMKITMTVKNTSDVPVGKKETDTETAVTLVYSFK